jgi:Coenzyme PQQ synthesis protein D (PqqD)
MSIISQSTRVTISPDVVSCDLAGEVAILNMKDGVYYGLDPVGATIWNLIQKPIVLEEVRDKILEEYDVEAEECQEDLLELIEKLVENGLVEVLD